MESRDASSMLRQFRGDGCLSYALVDAATREAVLIDPTTELLEDYREWIAGERIRLVAVLDTHTHADHFSATHLLRKETGAEIGMSHATASQRPTRRLREGDTVKFGAREIAVFETPGHTEDGLAYFHAGQVGMLFTGDTLLLGTTGRTDFGGSDPVKQYDALQKLLEKLPPTTVVFPGHDYTGTLFSTLETEKKTNPHLQIRARDEFVKMKLDERQTRPSDEVKQRLDFNTEANPSFLPQNDSCGPATKCGVTSRPAAGTATISVDKFRHKVEERAAGTLFVDVRERDEFAAAHIPGAVNFPLSELAQHLPELRSAKRIYVSCLSGMRSAIAARTLGYVGIPDVVNVSGGFQAWSQQGLPVVRPS